LAVLITHDIAGLARSGVILFDRYHIGRVLGGGEHIEIGSGVDLDIVKVAHSTVRS
jgi:hypothetical protein